MRNSELLLLKLRMKDVQEFKREIDSRLQRGKAQPSSVIKVRTWHTPENAQDFSVPESEICQALERTNSSLRISSQQSTNSESDTTTEPYVLVMDRGGHSLYDECASQRIAGYNIDVLRHI